MDDTVRSFKQGYAHACACMSVELMYICVLLFLSIECKVVFELGQRIQRKVTEPKSQVQWFLDCSEEGATSRRQVSLLINNVQFILAAV